MTWTILTRAGLTVHALHINGAPLAFIYPDGPRWYGILGIGFRKRGLPQIGGTLDQVKQRAEEWTREAWKS